MARKQSDETIELYRQIIQWINQQDLFYVKDLLENFDIERTDYTSKKEAKVNYAIKRMANSGHIQRCGKKGRHTQYIVVSPADINIMKASDTHKSKFSKNYEK